MLRPEFFPSFNLLFSVLFVARVVTDRVTGYSKGFGFVKYATLEDAAKGIEGMDGKVSWDHFPVFSFETLKFIWCVCSVNPHLHKIPGSCIQCFSHVLA